MSRLALLLLGLSLLGPTLAAPASRWVEAEALWDPQAPAAGAQVLPAAAASGDRAVSLGGAGLDPLVCRLELPTPFAAATLLLRYAASPYAPYFKLGRLLKVWHVRLDGGPWQPIVLLPTQELEHQGDPRWGLVRTPLGALAAGAHVLELRPTLRIWRHQALLDGFWVTPGPARCDAAVGATPALLELPAAQPPGAALTIDPAAGVVDLAGPGWRLRADPQATGEESGWHTAGITDDDWRPGQLVGSWASQGLTNHAGFVWYRRWLTIPETWRGRQIELHLGRIEQYGWIWVNGALVRTTWNAAEEGACAVAGGSAGVGRLNLTDHLQYGAPNLLTVRVWGPAWGGIWQAPTLLTAGLPVDAQRGFAVLPQPAPAGRYGLLLGWHNDAWLAAKGFSLRLLARGDQTAFSAAELAALPLPRHLLNRHSPVVVLPADALPSAVNAGARPLEIAAVAPFAQRSPRPQLRRIRPRFAAGGPFDVTLLPRGPFQRSDQDPAEFDLTAATPPDLRQLGTHLHGQARQQHGPPPIFLVDYAAAGEFGVFVEQIGVDARLQIQVDDQPTVFELPAAGQPGSRHDDRWNIDTCTYNQRFAVPVSAGRHRISVRNIADSVSWIRVRSYDLTRYASDDCHGLAAGSVPRYQPLAIEVDLQADYANPYDSDDVSLTAWFTTPAGRIDRVAGFFRQDFTTLQPSGALEPQAGAAWQIRYTPRETGLYRWQVALDDGQGLVRSGERQFTCTASESPGFVRVSRRDPRYLEHDNGQPFFILGVSGWLPQSLAAIDAQFALQASFQQNYAFLPTFQWGELRTWPDVYSQFALHRLDQILDSATRHGIYLQVFDDELRRGPFEDKAFYRGAGGPCETPDSVYTNGRARAMCRNLVELIAARYAASPQLLYYGYGDEVSFRQPEPLLAGWISELVATFRQADVYEHPTIIGEGGAWQGRGSDLVDLGGWYVPSRDIPDGLGTDLAALTAAQIEPLLGVGKPVFSSEGGLCEIGPGLGQSAEAFAARSPNMVHLHNQLWASFHQGFAGGGTEWLSYLVTKFEQHHHLRALARYLAGEPLTTLGLQPLTPAVSPAQLRCWAMRGPTQAFLWVQDRRATWYRQVMQQEPLQAVEGGRVSVDGLTNGRWEAEFWDTTQGVATSRLPVTVTASATTVELPRIRGDVAVKLRRSGP
ncbi:MAG: DUF5060 domain-containing protein [Fimbriimonadaceae bacterium]|nr:DUF5060 domain-containing protein [Fimbriimonadaceae bacterium]